MHQRQVANVVAFEDTTIQSSFFYRATILVPENVVPAFEAQGAELHYAKGRASYSSEPKS